MIQVTVKCVADCYSSLGSDLHPARLPTFQALHSFADSVFFPLSPSFPTPLSSLSLAILPSRITLSWNWSCFSLAYKTRHTVWPFRTEVMGATDLQHPPQSNQEAVPREQPSSYPSFIWSSTFQSDLACHSDYAFWLIFYEA